MKTAVEPGDSRQELLARLSVDMRMVAEKRSQPRSLYATMREADRKVTDREVAILSRRLPELERVRAAGIPDGRLCWVAPVSFAVIGRSTLSEFEGVRIVRLFGSAYGLLIRA